MYPRHTPQVLLALRTPKTFNELERETHIPPSTLSRSLRLLMKSNTISTRPLDEKEEAATAGMWKYELTNKGRKLVPTAGKLEDYMAEFWTTLEKD